ncbi:LOW QUALITY PROTEIN: delta heavy chain [Plecturocebus cupreus]
MEKPSLQVSPAWQPQRRELWKHQRLTSAQGRAGSSPGLAKSRTASAQQAFAHRSDLLSHLPAAAQAPVKLSLNLLASSAPPEAASWLLCKVSGFSPPDVLLTWLQDQHELNASWFATAHPAPQPGSTAFQAWSVLRVPAPPSPQPATYMCKVHHKASQTLLNASLSLDVSCESPPGPRLGGGLCGGHKELESTLGRGGVGQGFPGHTGPLSVSGVQGSQCSWATDAPVPILTVHTTCWPRLASTVERWIRPLAAPGRAAVSCQDAPHGWVLGTGLPWCECGHPSSCPPGNI